MEANGNRPVVGKGEIIIVPAITIDDFISGGGSQPHLVKIDVEGGEYEVLRGGAKLFGSQRPLIIAEVHHQEAANQICSWVNEYQYCSRRCSTQADVAAHPEVWDTGDFPQQLFAWPPEYEEATWIERVR